MTGEPGKYATVIVLVSCFLLIGGRPAPAQVKINELLASNCSVNRDNDFSAYSDWLELFNPGNSRVDLSGYSLSDARGYPGKWFFLEGTEIAANGYLLVWADGNNTGLHTNFKLGKDGEHLSLTDPFGEIIDSVTFPEQLADVSFGRDPADTDTWLYFSDPTPASANLETGYSGFAGQPVFSPPGGFYTAGTILEISPDQPGSVVRYTLDGSDPDAGSEIFSGPIPIDSTTVVRARCCREGSLPGNTATRTYFVGEGDFTLPVISISADPADLWDDETGIYVEGNADCDCGMNLTGNYCCTDWEIPIGIELFEPGGTRAFGQNAGLKIFGSGSRKRIPQRSLSIFARGCYGSSTFAYRLFPDKPIDEFSSFILRSSAHDWIKTLFRDALIQYLGVETMDLDYQAYRPSVVFINGKYWGIHNIREKLNEEYLASNHGVDPDRVDILERDSWIVEGDNQAYESLLEFVSTHDMTLPQNYEQAAGQIDVEEYIDYLILHIYAAKSDWPSNNIKFWRPQTGDGKWRWMVYDMDFGFGLDTERFHDGTYDRNMMALVTDPDGNTWNNPPWSTLLIRKMLENPSFRDRFLQQFCNHLNISFEPDRVLALIEAFKSGIEAEIPRHISRWGGTYALELGYVFESPGEWDSNIDVMREFAMERPAYMWQHLQEVFGPLEQVGLTVRGAGREHGMVLIDGIPVEDTVFTGQYFSGIPVMLEAKASPGRAFTGWAVTGYAPELMTLVPTGSEWKYMDDGSEPDESWKVPGFDDSGWDSGKAQLGYGDGDETTLVGYGPDPDHKYITTYFRHGFEMNALPDITKLKIRLLRDDGAIVYLNGQEVVRSNMEPGPVDSQTTAKLSVPAVSENIFLQREVPAESLVEGDNLVAVEIHQYAGNSSDISFDMELEAEIPAGGETYTLNEAGIELDMLGNYTVTAGFREIPGVRKLYINEFMAANNTSLPDGFGEYDDWIEIFNTGDTAIDLGGFFLTDDLDFPDRWQIPGNHPETTTVEAGSAILFWADGDTDQGPLHAGFRLEAEGEQIGLSMDGVHYIDSLTYGGQIPDVSWGRTADGDGAWQPFTEPTPGKTNGNVGILKEGEGNPGMLIYPNPASDAVRIRITGSADYPARVTLFDMVGRVIWSTRIEPGSGHELALDLAPFGNGIYVVSFRTPAGTSVRKLIIKK